MRRYLPALLFVLPLACAEVVQRPPSPPVNWASLAPRPAAPVAAKATTTEKERVAAGAYMKGLASTGFADLGPALDEEAHFRSAGSSDVLGRENVVKAHDALLGRFSERTFALKRLLLADRSLAIEWTMTGTATLRGLTLLWTRGDGSISDVHLYFDQAGSEAPGPAEDVEQRRSPAESVGVAIVRTELQALEENHEAAYAATMAGDLEVVGPSGAERGIPAVRAWFRKMRGAIAYLSPSIENIWGIGPYVVCEYHLVGEERASARDGLSSVSLVDVAEIRDGKIARVWRYRGSTQPALSEAR